MPEPSYLQFDVTNVPVSTQLAPLPNFFRGSVHPRDFKEQSVVTLYLQDAHCMNRTRRNAELVCHLYQSWVWVVHGHGQALQAPMSPLVELYTCVEPQTIVSLISIPATS
jgi:hypothetical protein